MPDPKNPSPPDTPEKPAEPKTYISQSDFYLEFEGRGRFIRAWTPFVLPAGYPTPVSPNWLVIDPNNPPAPPPLEIPGVVRVKPR